MAYEMLPGTRAPVRVWTDPASVEPEALGSCATSPPAVGARRRGHAGRALRQGRHGRLGDRDAAGRLPGRGRRRHRLRHDRGADHPDRRRPARTTSAGCAPRSRPRSRSGSAAHQEPVDPSQAAAWHGAAGTQFWQSSTTCTPASGAAEDRARQQLGTLGGGNHFIELCLEQGGADDGRVWLMLHSGSRNIGKELAERHIGSGPQQLPHNAGPARPGPGGLPRRHARRWTPTAATCSGRRSTRAATAP